MRRECDSVHQAFHPTPSVLYISSLQVCAAAHEACHSSEHFSRRPGLGETALAAQPAADGSICERHSRRTLSLAAAGRRETLRKPHPATHSTGCFMNEQADKYTKTLLIPCKHEIKCTDVIVISFTCNISCACY